MLASSDATVRLAPSIAEVDTKQWDACANPHPATFNPFVSHAFLKALEDAGTVGARTGWLPRHLIIEDERGDVAAAAPAYAKSHSQGEYVFDHSWADAYEQAGGRYYPKLQIAVPFTPVPGPRLLVKPGPQAAADEELLAAAAIEIARQNGLSSVHLTFLAKETAERLQALGYLMRTGQQFHWQNRA
jgi:predicted N-acyltransferase